MSEVLKKFGKYYLLDLMAQGGMAEIYRARLSTQEGMGRLVVIKRIQTGFGTNKEFVSMFRSEIKVTLGFNHPNIVQLYDFGEEQNQPYIVMEYVEGKNIRQLLNRFIEQGKKFPIELATFVIEQSAAGLNYAHSFKDKISGASLKVVHRDISPQNLIVSYDGNVKIIDFGIAKATTNSEQTRAGVIKGKPSYLAPEQIAGVEVDGRVDLFALGAVFWEILTGKKLFQGDSDLAVLKMIEGCDHTVEPPSAYRADVPKELDQIVLKLLQKNPDDRFKNGDELQRALRRFNVQFAPDFNPSDLAQTAKTLFHNELVEDRLLLQTLNEQLSQLTGLEIPELPRDDGDATRVAGGKAAPLDPTFGLGLSRHQADAIPSPTVLREQRFDSAPPPQRLVVEPISPIQTRNSPKSSPYGADAPAATSFNFKGAFALAFFGILAFGFMNYAPSWMKPWVNLEAPLHGTVTSHSEENNVTSPAIEGATEATLTVQVIPYGFDHEILLNGRSLSGSRPIAKIPYNQPVKLEVSRPGFKTETVEFTVAQSDGAQITKEIELLPVEGSREPASNEDTKETGKLAIVPNPSAEVILYKDGKLWGRKLAPFMNLTVPAGDYKARLYNAALDVETEVAFTVETDRTTSLKPVLTPRSERKPASNK